MAEGTVVHLILLRASRGFHSESDVISLPDQVALVPRGFLSSLSSCVCPCLLTGGVNLSRFLHNGALDEEEEGTCLAYLKLRLQEDNKDIRWLILRGIRSLIHKLRKMRSWKGQMRNSNPQGCSWPVQSLA